MMTLVLLGLAMVIIIVSLTQTGRLPRGILEWVVIIGAIVSVSLKFIR